MALPTPGTNRILGYPAGSTIQTAPVTPPAPSIGTITSPNDLQLLVPINGIPANADYVELWWADTEAGDYVMYSAGPETVIGVEVGAPGTQKWFKAKAINRWGESGFSAAVSGTSSGIGTQTPGQVQNLRVTGKTQNSISYAWYPLPGITSYTIQRWGGSNWVDHQVTGLTAEAHTYSGLSAGTEYGARVRGVNSGAAEPNGPFSAEAWDSTEAAVGAPNAGTLLATPDGQTAIDVTQGNAGSGWDTQSIQRANSPSGPWTQVATSLPHRTSGLTAGQTRYYKRIVTNTTTGLTAETPVIGATTDVPSVGGELFFDGFESGSFAGPQNGLSWGSSNAGTGSSVGITTAQAKTGSRSLAFAFRGGASGVDAWAEKRFSHNPGLTEITIEFDLYVPSNYNHRNDSPSNNKIFRVWGAGSGVNDNYNSREKCGACTWARSDGGSSFRFDANTGTGIGPKGSTYNDFITPSDRGKWVNYRLYAKAPTASTPTLMKLRKNGVLALTVEVSGTYDPAESHLWQRGYILGWANSGFDNLTTLYVDNVRFYSEEV